MKTVLLQDIPTEIDDAGLIDFLKGRFGLHVCNFSTESAASAVETIRLRTQPVAEGFHCDLAAFGDFRPDFVALLGVDSGETLIADLDRLIERLRGG